MKRKLTAIVVAALLALVGAPAAAQAEFGIESVGGSLTDPSGAPLFQAGAHPDLTTEVQLKTDISPESGKLVSAGNPRDIEVTLSPGMIGNPSATPKCSESGLIGSSKVVAECPPEAQVGVVEISLINFGSIFPFPLPVYNIEAPPGVSGWFGFNVLGVVVHVEAGVANDGEYRIRSNVANISQALSIAGTKLALWGVPAASDHDAKRYPKGAFGQGGNPVSSTAPPVPLMTNPSSCPETPLRTDVRVDSWRDPGVFHSANFEADGEGNPIVIDGCDAVPFEPDLEAQPTSHEAEAPTGLALSISLPQHEAPEGLSTSTLRRAVVTLPEGMTVNPSSVEGLGSCSPTQIRLESEASPACPPNSKIGTVTIDTPLLENQLAGGVYLAQQGQNKFGSLLALYLAVDDAKSGTVLKLAGQVEPDPRSGRLVASFDDQPQLPFERLQVRLFGGPRASLLTPAGCGVYGTSAALTGWSGTVAEVSDRFEITSGPEGSACPSGRFEPALKAGAGSPLAGAFSPFVLRVTRADGTQALGSLDVSLPKGLLASLAGRPYCPDSTLVAIPSGEGSAAGESHSPACPAASRVGTVNVGAGAGTSLFRLDDGRAYLAGPYKGAPLSLAFVTPALAGPFDLGNVVVRAALRIDPESTQVTAVGDPLPTILHGIPLHLREVEVNLNSPRFTVNPTSCAAGQIGARIASATGTIATPTTPFQVVGCRGLGFAPKLKLQLKGATKFGKKPARKRGGNKVRLSGSTKRGDNPALHAVLTMKPGGANIARASVALPHSAFLDQAHIRTICTRVQFAEGNGRGSACPKGSIYGRVRAVSPLLDYTLYGKVYLRSSNHPLPDLVPVLEGPATQPIAIALVGRIDSKHGGIRTTFEGVPDAPVSKFVLDMQGGKRGLIENSRNLCKSTVRATVVFDAQNGRRARMRPVVKPECSKKRRKDRGRHGPPRKHKRR